MTSRSIVALIPARSGSKRIPNKNIRELGGQPLMDWTIEAARESGIFDSIIVSSDSKKYGQHVLHQGIGWVWRDEAYATDESPDFEWVSRVAELRVVDAFAILRPTSPFRTAETIRRAWKHFLDNQPADSLRAVERVKQHPGKMWQLSHVPHPTKVLDYQDRIEPLIPLRSEVTDQPWHSSPTQVLPTYYVQNASLEIAWTKTITEKGTITGDVVIPFFTEGIEGFDINTEDDWREAERIVESLKVVA